jgi:hypothetical protein
LFNHALLIGTKLAAASLLALVLAAPASARKPVAHTAVFGGDLITAEQAPWAVWIISDSGACSGSIISASEILTAAHCAGDPPSSYRVRAGWHGPPARNADDAFDQVRGVTALRSHPRFNRLAQPSYGDVAVLTLDAPFDISGPRVGVIALADTQQALTGGLRFFGYGKPDPLGELRGFDVKLLPRWRCGSTAIYVCGVSQGALACKGDSGGGVVTTSRPYQLVAVADFAFGECTPGTSNGWADATAPEIRRWVLDGKTPPRGPTRTLGSPVLFSADASFSGGVHCSAGSWVAPVTIDYAFYDEDSGRALPSVGDTYALTTADAGRKIRCVASVTNDGGTAQVSPGVLTVPVPAGLAVNGSIISAPGFDFRVPRPAVLSFTRGAVTTRVYLVSAAQALPVVAAGTYDICLDAAPAATYTAWHECIRSPINGQAATLVSRVRTKRKGARFRVTLAAAAPAVGQRAIVTWFTKRCRKCGTRRVGRSTVTLRLRRTLRSPVVRHKRIVRMRVELPAIPVDGAQYTAGTTIFTVGRRR